MCMCVQTHTHTYVRGYIPRTFITLHTYLLYSACSVSFDRFIIYFKLTIGPTDHSASAPLLEIATICIHRAQFICQTYLHMQIPLRHALPRALQARCSLRLVRLAHLKWNENEVPSPRNALMN